MGIFHFGFYYPLALATSLDLVFVVLFFISNLSVTNAHSEILRFLAIRDRNMSSSDITKSVSFTRQLSLRLSKPYCCQLSGHRKTLWVQTDCRNGDTKTQHQKWHQLIPLTLTHRPSGSCHPCFLLLVDCRLSLSFPQYAEATLLWFLSLSFCVLSTISVYYILFAIKTFCRF